MMRLGLLALLVLPAEGAPFARLATDEQIQEHEERGRASERATNRSAPASAAAYAACTDSDRQCARWAKIGECEKNRAFME